MANIWNELPFVLVSHFAMDSSGRATLCEGDALTLHRASYVFSVGTVVFRDLRRGRPN